MTYKANIADALTGAAFHDYEKLDAAPIGLETKDEVPEYSAQVCEKHAEKFKMTDGLDRGIGSGTCGVVGCAEEAVHSYHFSVSKHLESYGEPPLVTPIIPKMTRVPRKRKAATKEPGIGITGVE